MGDYTVTIKGMDKVQATLKKLANGAELADDALRKTAANSLSDLQRNSLSDNPQITGMNTGSTARAWTNPFKVQPGQYRVSNNYKTRDGKRNIVTILDEGHGEIKPSKKFLYIPLNKKAAMKAPGADIPKEFKRGTDFIFATRVKPFAGRNFIQKNIQNASKELKDRLMQAIRAAIK